MSRSRKKTPAVPQLDPSAVCCQVTAFTCTSKSDGLHVLLTMHADAKMEFVIPPHLVTQVITDLSYAGKVHQAGLFYDNPSHLERRTA